MAEAGVVTIVWPDGRSSRAAAGEAWLAAASRAGQMIPSACRTGSCGACEIEVNGVVTRACIITVPSCPGQTLEVRESVDPYW